MKCKHNIHLIQKEQEVEREICKHLHLKLQSMQSYQLSFIHTEVFTYLWP